MSSALGVGLQTEHHLAAFNRAARPDGYANPDTKIPPEYRTVYARLDILWIVPSGNAREEEHDAR